MGKRLVGLTLLLAALGMACGDDSGDTGGTGGQQMQQDPAVIQCGNATFPGDGVCSNGFKCTDVVPQIAPQFASFVQGYTCACPNTGVPPQCTIGDPAACSSFPGTTCQDPGQALAGVAINMGYCLTTPLQCTPPNTGVTGGTLATGGIAMTGGDVVVTGGVAMTGGDMPATGGDMTATGLDPACGFDPSKPVDDAGCMGGMTCNMLLPGSYTCTCPGTGLPPTCDPADPTACSALGVASTCATVQGVSTCVSSCMPPGAPIVECPANFMCTDLAGQGSVCTTGGFPPACPNGDECAQYGDGFFCTPIPILGPLCMKPCTAQM